MITEQDRKLAKKLKSLRDKHGYLQKNLAQSLHLKSQQEYFKLESGKKHFTDELIQLICQTFGITESEFKMTTDKFNLQFNSDHQIFLLNSLCEAQKKELLYLRIIELFQAKIEIEKKMKRIKKSINKVISNSNLKTDKNLPNWLIYNFNKLNA